MDATEEISFFIQTLCSKIHLSRSPAEAEDHTILKDIQKKVTTNHSHAHPHLLSNIPTFQETFIGRVNDLQKLQAALKGDNTVVLMNGMGGIGKTTLAMHLIQEGRQEYDHIAWIEQVGDFTTSVLSTSLLLKNLSIENLSGDPQNDVLRVFHELSNISGRCLLVLDNADEGLLPYKRFLAAHWQVLITSRHELGFPNTIYLGFLTEAEALELFFEHYRREQNNELAMDIIIAVDLHTLTVEILAKTAQRQRIGLEELKNLLAEKGLDFGKDSSITTAHSKEEKIKKVFGYLQKVFAISEADFTENEIWLLKQFVALPPVFHKYELLESLLVEDGDKDKLIDALAGLKEKGWLIFGEEEDVYKMHIVVQELMLNELTIVFDQYIRLVKIIANELWIEQETGNVLDNRNWVSYGTHLSSIFWDQEAKELISLYDNLRFIFQEFGLYDIAVEFGEKALKISKDNFEDNYSDRIACLHNLANVYIKQKKIHLAVSTYETAFDQAEKVFEKKHPTLIAIKSGLGIAYRNLYDALKDNNILIKARKHSEEALSLAVKVYGENSIITAKFKSNLALIYVVLGDLDGAFKLQSNAIEVGLKKLGDDHLTILRWKRNLGDIELKKCNFQKALLLFEKAYDGIKRNYNENHPYLKEIKIFINYAIQKGAEAGDPDLQKRWAEIQKEQEE